MGWVWVGLGCVLKSFSSTIRHPQNHSGCFAHPAPALAGLKTWGRRGLDFWRLGGLEAGGLDAWKISSCASCGCRGGLGCILRQVNGLPMHFQKVEDAPTTALDDFQGILEGLRKVCLQTWFFIDVCCEIHIVAGLETSQNQLERLRNRF